MRVAYVPASAIEAEPNRPLTASAYVQPAKQQAERIAAAHRFIKQGTTALAVIAQQRCDIAMRQVRLGIVEIAL